MPIHDHSRHEPGGRGGFWTSRSGVVLLAFLAMGGTLLFTEHRAHVLGILPFLFLLACPLLHMFGHGGHEGHSGQSQPSNHKGSDSGGSSATWDATKGGKS
jgi:hypothetical protein